MAESLRALVVEDDVYMRLLLRSLLLSLGIRDLFEAKNGKEALAILSGKEIDFILTDLSMEPMNGIELTRAVRHAGTGENPYVPIIMVTGHSERHRVEAARDAGVTEFLAKPITINSLILRISEIVDRPRPYVHCDNYFGPDRRRRSDETYAGPWRRSSDTGRKEGVRADTAASAPTPNWEVV